MFEMSSDQIIDFWDFWKKITHKSHISCAELLCSSHAKDTNQETSHKMAFVAFCSVTWSARTCYSFSCYLNIHSSENKWDMIAHRYTCIQCFTGPSGSHQFRISGRTSNTSIGFSASLLSATLWRPTAHCPRGLCGRSSPAFGSRGGSHGRSLHK